MQSSCGFQAIFSIVWRAFRQFNFKFTAGQSQICRSIPCDELFEAKKDKAKSVLLKGTTRGTL